MYQAFCTYCVLQVAIGYVIETNGNETNGNETNGNETSLSVLRGEYV